MNVPLIWRDVFLYNKVFLCLPIEGVLLKTGYVH
jgi:hypothetical protein